MGKILRYEEIKKDEHVKYSESYEVNFWIQKEDSFWEKRQEMYFGETKAEHDSVTNRWQKDYTGKKVKLISVIYQ